MGRALIEVKPRLVAKGRRAMGPGKADLLDQIKATGSISAAAKAMEMSYSRAWQLVDTMNKAFKEPLVEAETGGKRGGGARVTEAGTAVLEKYRAMQAAIEHEATRYLAKFEPLLK